MWCPREVGIYLQRKKEKQISLELGHPHEQKLQLMCDALKTAPDYSLHKEIKLSKTIGLSLQIRNN